MVVIESSHRPSAQPVEIIYKLYLSVSSFAARSYPNDSHQTAVGLLDSESKRDEENSNRVESLRPIRPSVSVLFTYLRHSLETNLEHLDKADAQTQVGVIREDETARE